MTSTTAGQGENLKRMLVCFLALVAMTSCSGDTRTVEQRFWSALDDGLRGYSGTGVSVAVIAPDHPIWLGAGGLSHDTTPVSSDSTKPRQGGRSERGIKPATSGD